MNAAAMKQFFGNGLPPYSLASMIDGNFASLT
jgi:hypothetical protein